MGKSTQIPTPDFTGAANTQQQHNRWAMLSSADVNRPNETNPFGSSTWTRNGTQYTNNITLNPQTQGLLSALQGYGQNVGQGLGQGPDFSRVTQINSPNTVDTSGLVNTPERLAGERQNVSDAMYGQATRYLGDQFGRQEETLRSRLANQGLSENSAAFGNAMRDFYRAENDAYGNAADRATIAGQNAVTQDIGSLVNSLTAQSGIGNTTFNQSLAANQAGMGNVLTERNQPITEYSALAQALAGIMPANARGGNGSVGAGMQAGDYQGAAQQQYQAALNQLNMNNGMNASMGNSILGMTKSMMPMVGALAGMI